MERIKYITNKELLAEIDRSKKTYSYYSKPEYSRFDAIVHNVAHITPAFIQATLERRLELLAKQSNASGEDSPKVAVSAEDLVFRVMTNEHIPIDLNRKRRPKVLSDEGQTKTPFPPFKHYVIAPDGAVEVGRSHWKGDLQTGCFSLEHGKITNRLAMMFMLLVERYSRRGNWRGYCVDQATEALTQRGWLDLNEITNSDVILSYDAGMLKWSKIKSIFRDDFDGKMFKLDAFGLDALVTPGHKFVTAKGLTPVEFLVENDQLVLMGSDLAAAPDSVIYDDHFVRFIGWFVAHGDTRHVSKTLRHQINAVAEDGILSMPFILSLAPGQRELLIRTMIDAMGCQTKAGHFKYRHQDKRHLDAFVALCTIAGYRTLTRQQGTATCVSESVCQEVRIFRKPSRLTTKVAGIDFHGGKKKAHPGRGKFFHQNEATVDYRGKVWCPQTEYGCFMARRNGTIYLTGNTYNDEMRSHALLQLSQIGLQFDESKSDNPFAFYTQVIKNCFTRILNVERKNQNIRDDLLIIAGVQPSYTRQIDHEIEQRFGDEHSINIPPDAQPRVVELPKKRGRKPKAAKEGAR